MPDHKAILDEHTQHYQKSCAASGMEVVLKLHSLVDCEFREFQDKYGDTNIGFEKLADMAEYGVTAQDHETTVDDGFASIHEEVKRGHFPLLSIYSDPVGWHIWVAVPNGDSFRLLSRACGCDHTLELDSLNTVRDNLTRFRAGKIHFVTYNMNNTNGASSPMEELQLKKIECARRQLETSIELFFRDGDPVSIHTLTCAAYNVIRDLNDNRNGNPMFAKQRYVQMGGKPSLRDFNEPENFFKHADRDADGALTFYPKFTEGLLVDACDKYGEIAGETVPNFLAFTLWFMCQAPEQFDIPIGWEAFAEDAKELYAKHDRKGFYERLMSHVSHLHKQGT